MLLLTKAKLRLVLAVLSMWTMYQALPFVKKRNLYSGFFKKFSMSYHSFLVVSQDSVKLEHHVLLMRSVWVFDCFLTKVQPFLYSAMCLPWHRVCWWSIRSYGWSCTCMCSNNASPSWERGAGRNEPEKNMAQLRCHLSPSCEKLKGHCGIVFFTWLSSGAICRRHVKR